MPRYRLKTPIFDAAQFNGLITDEIRRLVSPGTILGNRNPSIYIWSLQHKVNPGDWIVREGDNLEVVSEHRFALMYEALDRPDPCRGTTVLDSCFTAAQLDATKAYFQLGTFEMCPRCGHVRLNRLPEAR